MQKELFQEALITWYQQNKRPLPWRQDCTPYHVWLSEIMCQQTQVDTVIPYYQRFLAKFPTIQDLAKADIDDVYHVWQGLGYYRRALFLHQTSQMITHEYEGQFPQTKKELMKLKGVGSYTAAAIASICFFQPEGVVDGNVFRVLSRVLAISDNIALPKTKVLFETHMDALINHQAPGDFNQGMMEIGALICLPTKPKCEICPLQPHCLAYQNQTQDLFPVIDKRVLKKESTFITAILVNKHGIYLYKNQESLLKGLYQLPQFECSVDAFSCMMKETFDIEATLIEYKKTIKHVFTHRIWHMQVYIGTIGDDVDVISFEDINQIAISTAHQKVLANYQIPTYI